MLSLILLGCSPRGLPSNEAPASNVADVAMLYTIYLRSSGGVGPSSEEEFRRFIRTKSVEEAKSLKIDLARLDELFISPRDGKPIIVNYGHQLIGSQTLPIIAYESQGREGMRMVAFLNGMLKEVDTAQAAELGLKEI
jgi:hypothetical protein